MSSTTISFTWKVDGVARDVTSAVLADPDGTFGVQRLDTGATVVAADTPLVSAGAGSGTYTYVFTDPAAGLTYRYFVKVVYNGATYSIEKQKSAEPPAPALPMYDTLAVADAIAAALPGLAKFKAATDDARTAGLVMSTMDLDAGGPYQGRKYDLWTPQQRQFPRVPYESASAVVQYGFPSLAAWLGGGFAGVQIWDWDMVNKVAIVPPAVLQAWVIQADAIIDGRLPKLLEDLRLGISSKTTGSISVAYRDLQRGRRDRLCAMAAGLMEQYLLRSGRLL